MIQIPHDTVQVAREMNLEPFAISILCYFYIMPFLYYVTSILFLNISTFELQYSYALPSYKIGQYACAQAGGRGLMFSRTCASEPMNNISKTKVASTLMRFCIKTHI